MPRNSIINFGNLAYRTGMLPGDLRTAGGKLFEQLSGNDPDLTKALVAAASESGLDPREVLSIMAAISEDFRRPLPENADHSLAEKSAVVGATAREKLDQTVDYAPSNLAMVDVSEIANRAKEAGQSVLENARGLAKSVGDTFLSLKNEKPDSDIHRP